MLFQGTISWFIGQATTIALSHRFSFRSKLGLIGDDFNKYEIFLAIIANLDC